MVGQFKKKLNELGEEYGKLGLDAIVKDVVQGAFKNAGKSKDEIIQLLGREIGLAWAAVLKEPLEKLLENKTLQIEVQLVSKKESTSEKDPEDSKEEHPESHPTKSSKKTKKTTSKKKTSR